MNHAATGRAAVGRTTKGAQCACSVPNYFPFNHHLSFSAVSRANRAGPCMSNFKPTCLQPRELEGIAVMATGFAMMLSGRLLGRSGRWLNNLNNSPAHCTREVGQLVRLFVKGQSGNQLQKS